MRFCINCDSNTTYINKKGYEKWHTFKDGYICHKCYMKLIGNPKITPEYRKPYNKKWHPITHPRRITFKGKRISLKFNPRKGICSDCSKKIGDEYIDYQGKLAIIKRTHLHHMEYHSDNPLKDTVELCVSCHRKETVRIADEK